MRNTTVFCGVVGRMAETAKLIELLQKQMEEQRKQIEEGRNQTESLIAAFMGQTGQWELERPSQKAPLVVIHSFDPFDPTTELWDKYWARFQTFVGANSVAMDKQALVFLTNQSRMNYKLLSNLAMQQSPAKDVNALTLDEIVEYMKGQFDPTRYVVRERFTYWSSMNRKPGESIQELAARICHDAVTCNFPAIRDPLDEAMRTRFMCSVSNEAVLKALFKYKEEELTFAKSIAVAMETEEAAKVAKETVYGTKASPVYKVDYRRRSLSDPDSGENPTHYACGKERDFPIGTCPRCGKSNHKSPDCPFRKATCRYCRKRGHLEVVCLKKRGSTQPIGSSTSAISPHPGEAVYV